MFAQPVDSRSTGTDRFEPTSFANERSPAWRLPGPAAALGAGRGA